MVKDAQDKERLKAERLREALRANLRRRKAGPPRMPADNGIGQSLTDDTDPKI